MSKFLYDKKILFGIIIIIAILIILILLIISNPNKIIVISSPNNSTPRENISRDMNVNFWINVTKTTGGLPLMEKDVYNALGLELIINQKNNCSGFIDRGAIRTDYSPLEGRWRFYFTLTDIASAKVKNTNISSNSIKSQTLKLIFPPEQKEISSPEQLVIFMPDNIVFKTWPCKNSSPFYFGAYPAISRIDLYDNVINETKQYFNFPLTASEFSQSLGYGYEQITYCGNRPSDFILTATYTQALLGDLTNCGYTYDWILAIPPNVTLEFDIISNIYWGLDDSSEAKLHVSITAPSNPSSMSEVEREELGISKLNSEYSQLYGIKAQNIKISVK